MESINKNDLRKISHKTLPRLKIASRKTYQDIPLSFSNIKAEEAEPHITQQNLQSLKANMSKERKEKPKNSLFDLLGLGK